MIRKAAAIACLLLAAACGGNANTSGTTDPEATGSDMRTMTEDEAAQRAEEHIKKAVAALPEKPTLTLLRADSAECLDPTDNGPRGRYEVSRSYWLDNLPEGRNAEFVDALHEYWTTSNFRVLTDKRDGHDRFVSVESNDDAFRMSVKESVEGDLSLGASSPCVWPDGTPPDEVDG
ncbi:hypothetical protein [Saccharomonospora xinjiangensis]|uniref:Lipoprotein n=1 Tax=Saccharomonospora xinjiangensis XJ-54 TaxID=882086 RepID=I0V8I1_9PSEU|nr:hypothetical protein [Saccharomonospora xinjiangensis]EID56434.1 hypothetical protein SacxiDRAFT_4253 [Saccharomonospora xinjiangensis XJ-54]